MNTPPRINNQRQVPTAPARPNRQNYDQSVNIINRNVFIVNQNEIIVEPVIRRLNFNNDNDNDNDNNNGNEIMR